MPSSWSSFFSRRYVGLLAVALGVLVASVSLPAGFDADDHTFRVLLRDGVLKSYDLFKFSGDTPTENAALVHAGIVPWWTTPPFKLHLIRPLTSLAFAFDCAVFGDHPLGYHVQSLAWFTALLVGAWLLFRRALPGVTGFLALLVFSLRVANVYPYAWISARHILCAAVPAVFALWAHVRERQDGWRTGRWLSPLLFVVGLAGSEAALALAPFWVTYAFFEWRATRDWKRAFSGAAPVLVIGVLYFAAYHALGGGARASSDYRDVLLAPGELLRIAVVRLPLLLGDALLGVPVGDVREGSPLAIIALGSFATVLCGVYWLAVRSLSDGERRSVAWLITGAVASLPMGLPGPPWGHMLVVPGVGFAALIGALIREGLSATGSAPARLLRRLASAGLFFMHVVVAPLGSVRATHWIEARGNKTEAATATIDLGDSRPKHVYVLACDQRDVAFFPKDLLADESPGRVACWATLSGLGGEHSFTQTGDRSFTLEAVGTPESQGYTGTYYAPLSPGFTANPCGATVRVDALGDNGLPSRLDVKLDEPLDSPDLLLLAWNQGRFSRFTPPGISRSADLPWGDAPVTGPEHVGMLRRIKRAVFRLFGQ